MPDPLSENNSNVRCPMTTADGKVSCQLPLGHNTPHMNSDEGGQMTWEARYVGEMRRELRDGVWYWKSLLQEVIDDLGERLTSEAIMDARNALEHSPAPEVPA